MHHTGLMHKSLKKPKNLEQFININGPAHEILEMQSKDLDLDQKSSLDTFA